MDYRKPAMNQHTPSTDAALAALGAGQHGVARTTHLLNAQLSPSAISRRVARGSLVRVYPGVFAIGHLGLSWEGECLAAVFSAGDDAALGRQSAARLFAVWRYVPERIHVMTPRQLAPKRNVRFHRVRN